MDDLVYRLRKRAEIRRQIPDRKSVQEGSPDRIADLLEEAADRIENRKWIGLTDEEIEQLGDKHLVNTQEYIGSGEYVSFVDGETDFARAIEAKLREKNHAI